MATTADIIAQLNSLENASDRFAFVQSIPGLDPGQQLRLATTGRFGSEAAEEVRDIISDEDVAGFDFSFALPPSAGQTPSGAPTPSSTPLPVGTTQLGMSGLTGGGSPAATGFPLFAQMVGLILQADQARRATIDQNIQVLRMFNELERVSPTRAAGMAAGLGLQEPDFSFLNVLFSNGPAFTPQGTSLRGRIGSQDVAIPGVLSGQQLSELSANPNVANVVGDVADFFGNPDIFSRSAQAAIPASRGLVANLGL